MFPPWYVRDMPVIRTDIGLVTHAHFDHDATERLLADMVFERMAGQFSLGDIKIIGIADKHVCETQGDFPYRTGVKQLLGEDPCPPNEALQWDNSLYVIETGGLRILHWGDNRQNPPDWVWEKIGVVDVAIIAVSDDGHILNPQWADVVMAKTQAKIVIPSHYFVKGVNIPGPFGLNSALQWTTSHEHTLLDSGTLTLSAAKVAKYKQHVMCFGDHVAFESEMKLPPNPATLPEVPAADRAYERFAPRPPASGTP